jgi:hypothetical protein
MYNALQNRGINHVRAIFFCLLCAILPAVAASEPEHMEPDRPGYSWGTHTVAPGHVYLESGIQISHEQSFTTSHILVLNIRFGITGNLEGFVSWDGFELQHNKPAESEMVLPSAGFKLGLFDNENTKLALVGLLEFSSEKPVILPALACAWNHALTENLDFIGMAGVFQVTDQPEITLAAGINIPVSARTYFSLEYYNRYNTHSTNLQHGNEAGIMYFVSNNLQLDIFSGISYGGKTGYYAGFGLARRI